MECCHNAQAAGHPDFCQKQTSTFSQTEGNARHFQSLWHDVECLPAGRRGGVHDRGESGAGNCQREAFVCGPTGDIALSRVGIFGPVSRNGATFA